MPSRRIVLEIPELSHIEIPSLMVMTTTSHPQTLPSMLLELSEHLAPGNERSRLVPTLRETARLLEALRLALTASSTEDRELMSEGELAIVNRLDTITDLLREVTIEKRNITPAEKER